MSSLNYYLISVGFNQYKDIEHFPPLSFAEKDAKDICDVLTSPQYGKFPKENVMLVTGAPLTDSSGPKPYQHTLVKEMSDLEHLFIEYVVDNRQENDVVVVYFSGHGFKAGKEKKTFLATPDTEVEKVQKNRRDGLDMEWLHRDIFLNSKAKNVIFLLDCCYSGAFCRHFKGSEVEEWEDADQALTSLIDDRFFCEGRVAFVSSPEGVRSRESKEFKNGIFTHYLLDGLRGASIEPFSGDVTLASLVSYVQAKAPMNQPPVYYGSNTRIVIYATPQYQRVDGLQEVEKLPHYGPINTPENLAEIGMPLSNPLDNKIQFIDDFLNCIRNTELNQSHEIGNQILSNICCGLDLDFAFIHRVNVQNDRVVMSATREQSNFNGQESLANYKTDVISSIYNQFVLPKDTLRNFKFGLHRKLVGMKGSASNVVTIPLRLEYPRDYIVLCGVNDSVLQLGEVLGQVLISLYHGTRELTSFQFDFIESIIYDNFKRTYGYVPFQIYQRRFNQFVKELSKVTFSFEPIVKLGRKNIVIASWEALARSDDEKRAPKYLFDAAELWGTHFVAELDLHCLRTATASYKAKWQAERGLVEEDPIAVNVYPETLFLDNYRKEVAQILQEDELISYGNLTLEISEKRPISRNQDPAHQASFSNEFERILQQYASELGTHFAIDDFGVENSSISRLAKLELDYIKIDRDILTHPYPSITLKYVLELVKQHHRHPIKIVVEGFDTDKRINISLSELYRMGIKYIQGHLFRRAMPIVTDLDPAKKALILELLRE